MDQQITETDHNATEHAEAAPRPRSAHLLCRTSLWGVAGFLGCGYFAWISYVHLSRSEYDWPHDIWTACTYVVWIILLCGLTVDTKCVRERIFFGILVVNFVVGGTLTFWSSATVADVRSARMITGILWALAAVVSLTTLGRSEAS
jgi:hypothetical protein